MLSKLVWYFSPVMHSAAPPASLRGYAYGHRRRSGWNSGERMASAEGGSVPSEVRYGEGSVMSSPSGVRGRAEN